MIDPRLSRALALVLVLLLLSAPVRAEDASSVEISGEKEGRPAAIRITDARKKLDDHKWSEAIEELQSIVNTGGNALVPVTPTHSVRAGRLCQVQLASLPPDALRLYRARYETQARKKLQQAQAERDVLQLRKTVEDFFCTRAAEKAIDLLGDLAFERGCFAEAEEWWRLLAPLPKGRRAALPPRAPAPPGNAALVYPDLTLDPARLQAKQLLTQLFQGADSEWTAALEAYQERHAKAEGTLAGRKGRYVDLLHELAEERRKQGRAQPEDWRTFGGDPSREKVIPTSEDILDHLSALCRDGPTWRFNLEQRTRQENAPPSPAVDAAQARTLAFYPVIVGHQVLVADARYVTAFDLRNGQSEQWYDAAGHNGGVSPNTTKLPAPPDLRYTLAAAGDHIYVRLGAQDIGVEAAAPPQRVGPPKPRRDNETFLACLSLRPDDKREHFRWKIDGNMPRDSVLFEGAPVVAKGLIWITSTRNRDANCLTAIDCYTTDDTSVPPLRWRCDVCQTREGKAGEPRYRHHLLTLAGTQIVYCTHTGAVVAVDALTGRRNWAVRYPRRASGDEAKLRDLTPVLFAAGRLYVAPADSDHLLCLDPATGRTLWVLEPARVPILGGKLSELEAIPIIHLLGVGQGRLIFTTSRGLRAVRADTGNSVWNVPDSGTLTPAGRGLLVGDLVLFPTNQQRDVLSPSETVVYALRQSDGRPADDPTRLHRLPAGNLAYANGCLAVADRRTLSVFVPPRLLLSQRQAAARHAPDSATRLLDLARAEADAEHEEKALRPLHRVEELLRREPQTSAVKKLLSQALGVKQDVLLGMALRAAQEKRWQDADNALEQAAAIPLSPRFRLHALLRSAQIWQDAGQTDRVTAVWKTILADESLRDMHIIDRAGRPASASAARFGERGRVSIPSASSRGADTTPLTDAPHLPLLRTWHVRLASDEWIVAGWQKCDPELLLTGSSDGRFRCRLTSTGDIRWQHRLPFAPCWAGCRANTILAAGAAGVACLRRDNGELVWHFPAPLAGRYPRSSDVDFRVILDPQLPETLTDFQLVAGHLFFLQGQRRLFALNAETGSVLWDRWAPDGALRLPPPRSCFSPCYHAGAETVLVQASGRRWLLETATGRILHEAADSRELWRCPPLQLDEHTLCVTPDSRHVVLVDAHTGKCLWTHRAAGDSTLSGALPSVLGRGEVLIYIQPANMGNYLHRLDPATGKAIWPQPLLLTAKTLDVSDWTFDPQALYGIEDRFLIARSLANGEVLWRRALPAGGAWQARRVGDYLALLPQASPATTRFRFRSLLAAVQWELGSLLAPDAISPVSWYDPKTGQLVQRLNFRIEAAPRTTFRTRTISQEESRTRTVRTSSLLASQDGPAIHLATPRPFVALGGEIWGLTATQTDSDAAASVER
jgi:outer membrane protein assembly factor BamB